MFSAGASGSALSATAGTITPPVCARILPTAPGTALPEDLAGIDVDKIFASPGTLPAVRRADSKSIAFTASASARVSEDGARQAS